MLELMDRGETFAVATVLRGRGSPGRIGHKMIVLPDGRTFGTVGGGALEERVKKDALEALRRGEGVVHSYVLSDRAPGGLDSLCGGKEEVAIEIVPRRPHLLILGGGHVGRAVARLCHELEYAFTVVDDREEMTRPEDWPPEGQVVREDPARFVAQADLAPFTHLVIVTYAHRLDAACLRPALERFPGPIGLIGSRRKRERILEGLPESLRAEAHRIRCPVGLPLGGNTPAEIAVSILAEVIRDRYAPQARGGATPEAGDPGARGPAGG
jgi:xanthine dehydrogenase accessory factor